MNPRHTHRIVVALVFVLTVLLWAVGVEADPPGQPVPGNYLLTWSMVYDPGDGREPFTLTGVTLLTLERTDEAVLGAHLCATPYVIAQGPSSPEWGGTLWCINADGSLDHSNFTYGAWDQETRKTVTVSVIEGHHGSLATTTIDGIANRVSPRRPR